MAQEVQQPAAIALASSVNAPSSAQLKGKGKENATTELAHRLKGPRPAIAEQYAVRDFLHSAAVFEARQKEKDRIGRKFNEVQDYKDIRTKYRNQFPPSRLYGEGFNGYGNGYTDVPQPRVLYPMEKPRLGKRRTPMLRIKRKDILQQAEQFEELVPIRIDVDYDKIKLRDTFTWNLHDRVVPLKQFTEQLVEDFQIPEAQARHVHELVTHQMYEQLTDFCPPVYFEEDSLDPELPYNAYKNDEMRILIKLNITIGPHTLVDQFEWDINNSLNSPEEFAESMTRELSLSGEFTTAIAHCIHEQVQLFTKSLYIVGHPFDGRPVEDADLVAAFMPSPITSAFRPHQQAKEFAPYLYEMKEADLEKNELIFSREQRRQKRSVNRRGGPTLPDLKDRQRTVRTLVVSSVLPGAAETLEDSRIFKRVPASAKGRGRIGAQGDGISDSEDEEDSSPDSPAMAAAQGTARTRGLRVAATAAQQRMANLGRSETPEAMLHHHETRTSARRFGGRDDSEVPFTLIVKLRIGKEKLKAWTARVGQPKPMLKHHRSASSVSGFGTPARVSMGPPTTPNISNQPAPTSAGQSTPAPSAAQLPQVGRVDAPPPPGPGESLPPAPPPPHWLTTALTTLRTTSYPHDRFEGMMRYSAVDSTTELSVPAPPAGAETPSNVKYMWLPRIRCADCPGKLYTPGPGEGVSGFEVHLRMRAHRERVEGRVKRESEKEGMKEGGA